MFHFCRHLSPLTNKTRAKSLNKETIRNDMRKFVINAQVKAMVSLLETISNIVYMIIVWLTVRTSFGTLLLPMTVYLVLLPYASLMNTSHNKERVIKNGWKSVFRNLLGRKSNTAILQTDKNLTNNDRLQKGFIESNSSPLDHCASQIFTTVSSDNVTDKNKVIDLSKHALLGDEPSTSSRQKAEKKVSPHLSETSSISTLQENKYEENVIQTLILKMIENINEEEIYIEHFKKLVTHKYRDKNECMSSAFPSEENMLPNFVSDDELFYKNINTRCKEKHSIPTTSESSKKRHSGILINVKELDELRNQRKRFLGNKDGRIKMRCDLLVQLVDYEEHAETYDSLLEKLIDIEESFVR